MKEFKIRASAAGIIMAGTVGLTEVQQKRIEELTIREVESKAGNKSYKPLTPNMVKELETLITKKDNPEPPQGAKTYCELWLKQNIYNRKKEFTSKQTDKGNWVELHSLKLIAKHLNLPELSKCDEYFENDFMTGNPDVLLDEFGIDAKNPWDCFTFPLFDETLPEDDYYWQGQQYMALTGRKLWRFVYVLSDTPEHLIKNEAKSYCYKNGVEMCPEIMDEFIARMTYPDIPEELKIKVFDVHRDENAIRKIEERVILCRKHIQLLTQPKSQAQELFN